MSKKISVRAVGDILDALHIARTGTLMQIPYLEAEASSAAPSTTAPAPLSPSALRGAETACAPLLRETILNAVELVKAKHPRTSAQAVPREEVGAALERRQLRHVDLGGARLTGSFNSSDLSHSSFCGSHVSSSTFNLSDLTHADLSGGEWYKCTFVGTVAPGVDATRARFAYCVFKQANLRDWRVGGASFVSCTFTMSDLTGWVYDSQTMVRDPTDWGRCRRLRWRAAPGSRVRECPVFGSAARALSLPPRDGEEE
ncbi:hypothetical protein STCU_05820 [Strigomonas culicis]|uniref:Uncharacterized protein n=1 Tax=Strigomonas culicis TaxID=28005 RepID=S9VVF3_9TRYP|nr:hypothetical protein STCU_05820 [Strigomonas culicis]|eukprot:EPY27300.1 hypothetical protein STCU_05820 [Strigomonas culicis]